MAAITVRIHIEDDRPSLADVVQVLPPDLFLVKEVGAQGRPHFQGLIYTEPSKEVLKKLRNDITRKLKLTGNRAYSVAEAHDPEGFIRYLCKGADVHTQPDVLVNSKGVDVAAGHAEYWAKNAKLKSENPKGYKRKSVWLSLQEVADPKDSAIDIGLKALKLYHEAGKIAAPNVIKNMVFTLRARDEVRARWMLGDLLKGL